MIGIFLPLGQRAKSYSRSFLSRCKAGCHGAIVVTYSKAIKGHCYLYLVMDWKARVIFFGFSSLVLLFGGVHAAVDSSPTSANQFGQCMLRKFSESDLFSGEDNENFEALVEVMTSSLQRVANDRKITQWTKVFLAAFLTSVAEITIDSEYATSERRQVYLSSVEQCSFSVTGTVDEVFLQEAKKILSVVESLVQPTESPVGQPPLATQENPPFNHSQDREQPPMQQPPIISASTASAGSSSSTSFSGENRGYSQPQMEPLPANIIENLLLRSPIFVQVFNPDIPVQRAIQIARALTEKAMVGFYPYIINDAVDAAGNAVSLRTLDWTTPDYAFAMGRAITAVLDFYGIPLSEHGARIANIMIFELQRAFERETSIPADKAGNAYQTRNQEQSTRIETSSVEFKQIQPIPSTADAASAVALQPGQPAMNHPESETFVAGSDDSLKDLTGESMDEYTGVILDKEEALSKSLLMTRNSLAKYGPDVVNTAEWEIRKRFQTIPNGSTNKEYASAFSDALVTTLVAYNLMRTINSEELAESMLQFLNKEEASQDTPGGSPKNRPQIEPSPVEEFIPQDRLGPSEAESAVNKPRGVSFTPSPKFPKDEPRKAPEILSSYKGEDIPLESGPAILENVPLDSKNQSTNSTIIEVSSTIPPSTTDPAFSVTTISSLVDTSTISETLSSTVADLMKGATLFGDFLTTQVYSTIKRLNDSSDFETFEESKPVDYDFYDETESAADSYDAVDAPENYESVPSNRARISSRASGESSSSSSHVETRSVSKDEEDVTTLLEKPEESSTVALEPSFMQPTQQTLLRTEASNRGAAQNQPGQPLEDPTILFAREISGISQSAVAYIRTGAPFDFNQLCGRLNMFASIVDIPPLTYCTPVALVDYLLNVLQAVTMILRSV